MKLAMLRRYLSFIRGHRRAMAAVFLCSSILTLLGLASAWIIKLMIDWVVPHHDVRLYFIVIGIAVGAELSRIGVYWLRDYLAVRTRNSISMELRELAFAGAMNKRIDWAEAMPAGERVYRLQTDPDTVASVLTEKVPRLLEVTLEVLVVLGITLYLNWRLTVIALATFPLSLLRARLAGQRLVPLYNHTQRRSMRLGSFLTERMAGFILVKLFRQELAEMERYKQSLNSYFDAVMRSWKAGRPWGVAQALLINFSNSGVIWYGWYLVIKGELTIGSLMLLSNYIFRLVMPLHEYGSMYQEIALTTTYASRLLELISEGKPTARSVSDEPSAISQLSFSNVKFGYRDDATVLDGITFTAEPGNILAIVGTSGVGKTTLLKLCIGLYQPWSGSIQCDGSPLCDQLAESTWPRIVMVTQDAVVFGGTVLDNLAYGRPKATREEVEVAARWAEAHDFIMELPEGYDTELSESGSTLSGGQRQRLTLARALVADPQVLLLDEATCFADLETEARILTNLRRWADGRLILLVTHRLQSARYASRVMMLHGGRIIEDGTHDELLAKGRIYRRMWDAQQTMGTENLTDIVSEPQHSGIGC